MNKVQLKLQIKKDIYGNFYIGNLREDGLRFSYENLMLENDHFRINILFNIFERLNIRIIRKDKDE